MRKTLSDLFNESSETHCKFVNRADAGRFLAEELSHYKDDPDAIVLALPRGGVPVGYAVAHELHIALDVFLVRKLGTPIFEELAMGAIATGGVRVLNEEVIHRLKITPAIVEAVTAEQTLELERREKRYRGDRPFPEITGRKVILVDDGLATGSTMRAAIKALRLMEPQKITVAVPIGCSETCSSLAEAADEVVCGKTPEHFQAVGKWYADFTQTTDDEVEELLNHSAHEKRVRELAIRRENQSLNLQPLA